MLVCPAVFMDIVVYGNHTVMADVATALCWQVLCHGFYDRCYYHFVLVFCCVVDGKPLWQIS